MYNNYIHTLINIHNNKKEKGSITIEVKWHNQNNKQILLSVIDTGRGMTQEIQKNLFKAFISVNQ